MSPKKPKDIAKTDKKKFKNKKNKPVKPNKQNKANEPAKLMGGQVNASLLIQPSPALEAKLFRVRRWGDPVMLKVGFDVEQVDTSNFQAVRFYNKETGFGAVTNFVRILREDIDNLHAMQFDQDVDGKFCTRDIKMNWLCQHRGTIYMTDHKSDEWQTAPQIRWGTLALGGNLVQVDGFEEIKFKMGSEGKRAHKMARIVCFRKTDWERPLDELLAEGLVHRCYCAYKNNQFGDSPKGIVYSPVFSPLDWDFAGADKPTTYYLPAEWLEPKQE